MAEAARQAQLRQRVASARTSLRAANAALKLVNVFFQEPPFGWIDQAPDRKEWAAEVRAKTALEVERLTDAELLLDCAFAYSKAAAPVLHLPPLGGVTPDGFPSPGQRDAAEQAAVGRMRAGCGLALDASKAVEWCRAHLSAGMALLESPVLPTDVAVTQTAYEFDHAYRAHERALQRTEAALAQLTAAQQILGA